MLLTSAGAAGQFLLFVFVVGVPVQFALAALIVLGRRIGGTVATFMPALLLGVGVGGMLTGLNDALAAVGGADDPAWIPWFALQDRARAMSPLVLGAAGAFLLVLPPLTAIAARVLRSGNRRLWAMGLGVVGGGAASVGMVATAGWYGEPGGVVFPAVMTVLLTVLAAVAASEGGAPRGRTGALLGPRVAAASFVCGALALLFAHVGFARFAGVYALPDFEHIYSRLGALDAQAAAAARAPWVVGPWLLVAGISLLPGIFLRKVRDVPASVGVDAVAVLGLGLALLVAAGWSAVRWELLSHTAGDASVLVLAEHGKLDVPHVVPVPPRVLFLEPGQARWVMMREHGGAEASDAVGALEDAAAALRRGDGLVIPPDMTLEDLYFTLADVQAGELAVVGCGEVSREVRLAFDRDALRAVGRCGAFPLALRVTEALRDQRTLIVLKDRLVDDGGDVVSVDAIGDVTGRDVLLRGQVDATFADLDAALFAVSGARHVYLAWGVGMDGDDVPVGVDPGIRIRSRTQPHPNGEVTSADPAGAEAAPAQ